MFHETHIGDVTHSLQFSVYFSLFVDLPVTFIPGFKKIFFLIVHPLQTIKQFELYQLSTILR